MELAKTQPLQQHEVRPGIANRNFPQQTRHLHQNNAYQFRNGKFVYMRKIYINTNESNPYRSAYQEDDMYADYDPWVGIKIACVLGFFLLLMIAHILIRSHRKRRERRQERLEELAQKQKQSQEYKSIAVEDAERGLPRIEVDVYEATAEWVQSLGIEDESDENQKDFLDVVFNEPRFKRKSSMKKRDYGSSSGTPSRTHSTRSLSEEEKHVHFHVARGRNKRWSSFSGMHGKRRHDRRKSNSMYVRRSRSHYEPLHRISTPPPPPERNIQVHTVQVHRGYEQVSSSDDDEFENEDDYEIDDELGIEIDIDDEFGDGDEIIELEDNL